MDLIIFICLVVVGYVAGSIAEKKHFASIRKREQELKNILTFSAKLPPTTDMHRSSVFVQGNVVISVDYFKRLSAGLRSLIGGRVSAYESLVDRARREALLRMKQNAQDQGANHIFNVKLETSSITKGGRGQIGAVEIFAYGTGLIP
ncbi:MAG: hypothetical protein ACJAVI_001159 [Candidatus Azotimanducaceae bacterium]|jgi:uncharacterized protein YbjQ (UPF0145 family)